MYKKTTGGFVISMGGMELIAHSQDEPLMYIGRGDAEYSMHNGNFDIVDYPESRIPLTHVEIVEKAGVYELSFCADKGENPLVKAILKEEDNALSIEFGEADGRYNRFWLRLRSDADEKLYGLGEQMSYFNLKGRNFPIWSREPGVGRDPLSPVTLAANKESGAGGDYYTVNFPQPTYISSNKYLLHLDATAYMDFDFRRDDMVELCAWQLPKSLHIKAADSFEELVTHAKKLFGTQPELPEWVYNGVILGVQGGTEIMQQKLDMALRNGIPVSGVWCQDWEGRRVTSFGRRLMWDWKWNEREYPELDKKIEELHGKGIKFLGYCNPYLAVDGDLYAEGSKRDVFVKRPDGREYIIDFGEFDCATVDLTNPEACAWYKGIIKKYMIDFGLDGWMADFGEYLPADAVLFDGTTGEISHNRWPVLWSKLNREVIEESGRTGEIFFFMRSGFTGVQGYCHMLWGGDQSVDFSRHDGMISAVCGALSSGIVGNGLYHSDIGGYTTLHGMRRTEELLLRWAEMAAFMPVMRTHEGNRPDDNAQFYDNDNTAARLGKMVKVYIAISPYMRELVAKNAKGGVGVVRPMFMHYDEPEAYEIQDQFMCGSDLICAPVWHEGETTRELYLPKDEWIHLFTGEAVKGGRVITVDAPVGCPAVFYRAGSKHAVLFGKIKAGSTNG